MGHEVLVANDGEAALQQVGDFRPDVLFSDISMPVMNGYELAKRLRAQPQHGEIVLVAMTGLHQPENRDRARSAGFDHHLVSPARWTTCRICSSLWRFARRAHHRRAHRDRRGFRFFWPNVTKRLLDGLPAPGTITLVSYDCSRTPVTAKRRDFADS